MSQLSFLQIAQGKKRLKCERFLQEMKQVIPWQNLIELIAPHYESQASTGRKKKDLGLMLKIICLQQWYGLSDPGVEEAIYDRNSFQKFLELDLLSATVPDESTVLHFRHCLEKHGLFAEIFAAINAHIESQGLLMKRGTLVDATLIAAPSSTKN
ncbi:MAG: transposase, partial [Gammaproteobacteria bacterium]